MTATIAARRATSVARAIASPARCTCRPLTARVVATATTATPGVVRAAATSPVAVATCRAVATMPARTPSSVRLHRWCVKWRSATRSPWPTWRRSLR
ncbi:hypothetical protein G6F63_016111 [Rhizopus arrhizus]|nr:hypothetical protein G6F23_015996 [Rhizopus arrhizus]KAG0752448.1 hypothetical protein G6F22_021860 [Rhizopus arrhizus]KAG1315623.1 hypothetical protein G6F63_016111 [Rhizopus arrhizus]